MKCIRSTVAGITDFYVNQPPPPTTTFLDTIPCLYNRIPLVDILFLVSARCVTLTERISPETY